MARIRTVKPEFWSHPLISRLKDSSKCLALALLNFSDDEGYFNADPILVRNFARPFDEDSTTCRLCLDDLSRIGWIELKIHDIYGPIGRIINFKNHQVIDKPKPSKIKTYFDSTIISRQVDDASTPEGNGKEQGTGNGKEDIPPTEKQLPDESLAIANNLFSFHRDRIDSGYKVSEANIRKWAEDIDRLNRLDGRSWDDISRVVDWIKQPGQFWSSNILSGSKLREKFSTIFAQMAKSKPLKVNERTTFLDLED